MTNEGRGLSPAEILEKIARLDREREELRIAYRVVTGGEDVPDTVSPVVVRGESAIPQKSTSRAMDIKPDTFFRMTYPQAARKYLEMVGHADRIENIYGALTEGGINIGGANPQETLSAVLRQATKVFVRVGTSTFGLRTFYPHMKDDPEKAKKPKPKTRLKAKSAGPKKQDHRGGAPKLLSGRALDNPQQAGEPKEEGQVAA